MAYQLLKSDGNSSTWADPANLNRTVRLKQTSAPKTANGVTVTNHLTEVIINDTNSYDVGSAPVVDALSVRLRASGSSDSHAELQVLAALLADLVDQWSSDSYLVGFTPSSVPIDPS
jgi:hypothetical protein